MIQRALILLQQSRYVQAEHALREVLAGDPEHAYAHSLLALSLMQQDKLQQAESEAKQAISLAPDQPYCHFMLGLVKTQGDDLQTARHAVEEAIRLNPEESDYHGLRSAIYLKAERWQEALDAANEGLTHDPTHQTCLNYRATALVKLNRYDEAHQTIGQALQKDPENKQTHANLGWALLHKGRHQQALEHFSEALRLDPNYDHARHGLVEALKARYLLYRWLLQFFLWMSTLPPRVRGGLIIGAFIIVRVLRSMARQNPSITPFVVPVVSVYGIFVLLTWIVDPLFNLLLQCNRYGRYALSKAQRRGSSVFGALLLGAVLSVICGMVTGLGLFYLLALNLGLLIIPAPRIFEAQDGQINRRSLALVAAMMLLGILAVVSLALKQEEAAAVFTILTVLGLAGFTWLGAMLGVRRPKV